MKIGFDVTRFEENRRNTSVTSGPVQHLRATQKLTWRGALSCLNMTEKLKLEKRLIDCQLQAFPCIHSQSQSPL